MSTLNTFQSLTYKEENNLVAQHLFENYFARRWKKPRGSDVFTGIELIISPDCNLGCKYCYMHKYHHKLYPMDVDEEKIKSNVLSILKWLDKNHYALAELELFSGELFAQTLGWDIVELIYEYEKNVPQEWRIMHLIIPTNFTFIQDENLVNRFVELQEKYKTIDMEIFLSASFDGFYEEVNRPWIKTLDIPLSQQRDELYYYKVFDTVLRTNAGLHPMVYSKHIEDWEKNFLWFQEHMEKAGIPWDTLYLLEVRNEEWTKEEVKTFSKFIEFLWDWTYHQLNEDKEALLKFIYRDGFNIMLENLYRVGRGMSCSVQTEFCIRVQDLAIIACHRTAYDQFILGHLTPDDDSILKPNFSNGELFTTVFSMTHQSFYPCNQCMINDICGGLCYGACYESNANFFMGVPTVCMEKYASLVAFVKMLLKYQLYFQFLADCSPRQQTQLEWLRKEIQ